jgi:hypothetical protein
MQKRKHGGGRAFFTVGGKGKSTMAMVNAEVVNAESSYFLHATFCVIFCDSGRILDSKIPVKYRRICNINHNWVASSDAYQKLFRYINEIDQTPSRNAFSANLCYTASKSKGASKTSKNALNGGKLS